MVSIFISILMFRLNSPIAGVFELSVCAGLISVIFITAISFTQRITVGQYSNAKSDRMKKYWILPFLIAAVGMYLAQKKVDIKVASPVRMPEGDVQNLMWNVRHMDILGQIIILLAGAIGVVILFKHLKDKK